MTARLAGRRAFVTGAGSGIGRAAAVRLAREGAAVVCADLRAHSAVEAASEIEDAGGTAIGVACDVGDEDQVRDAVRLASERLDGLDALVACAGISTPGVIEQLALEDWELVLRVNLTGMFLAAKHALPHLVAAGGGAIVTIGSVSSFVIGAGGGAASYAASKGGVVQLTKAIAVEHAKDGIRANCLCPGAVSTNLAHHVRELLPDLATQAPRVRDRITVVPPIERRADPEEVASVVAFLVSDDASFMTGSVVMVDGGYTTI